MIPATRFSVYGLLWLFLSTAVGAAPPTTPEITANDDRFYNYFNRSVEVETLASDLGWAEGPVWVDSLDSLIFSDVAKNRIYRWNKKQGLSEFLSPSGNSAEEGKPDWRGSNGLSVNQEGQLLLAQQGSRVIARMRGNLNNPQADYEILSDKFGQKKLNSPNDLISHPSGDLYFTDPPYGLDGFEKSPAIELDFFGVFRLARDGSLTVINRSLEKPNGIALSSDSNTLYVSNSEPGKEQIVAIDLTGTGMAKPWRLLFDASALGTEGQGSTDGMTLHASGTLFVSLPGGIGLLSPKGKLLGTIKLGQITNMAFDTNYNHLYLTAPDRLLRIKLKRKD